MTCSGAVLPLLETSYLGLGEMPCCWIQQALDRESSAVRNNPYEGDLQKVLSDEGKHNGLFWKSAEGQPQSPIGPLIADAAQEGYKKQNSSVPFHGYIYRVLKSQGEGRTGRGDGLHDKRKADPWIRIRCLSRTVPEFWCDDLYRGSRRAGLSKGPGIAYRESRSRNDRLQP